MKRLRWSIIALVLHLALFFNIERLDFDQENVIDILSFVYILGTLAVVGTLFVRFFRRRPAWHAVGIWIMAYGALRFTSERPFIGGIYLYLSITEILLLASAVLLAHRVALDLQDFEQAVINITLPHTNRRVHPINEALEEIQTEMLRSRRHQRPLSVVVVKPDPTSMDTALHRSIREIQQTMISRYVLTGLMRVIADVMRRTDTVLEIPDGEHIVVLSPETNAEQSHTLVERIQAAASADLGIEIHCGTASFPNDALTFDELVREASRKLTVSHSSLQQSTTQTPTERTTADGINTEA